MYLLVNNVFLFDIFYELLYIYRVRYIHLPYNMIILYNTFFFLYAL